MSTSPSRRGYVRSVSDEAGRTALVHLKTVSMDCSDADELAAFYSALLGWTIDRRGDVDAVSGKSGWVTLPNPSGGIGLAFGGADWYRPPTWPEVPGSLTKMMHFEIGVRDLAASVNWPWTPAGRPLPTSRPTITPTRCESCWTPQATPSASSNSNSSESQLR